MVEILTHSLVLQSCTQTPDENGVLQDPELGAPSQAFKVFYEPLTPGEVYDSWGVILNQAAAIQSEISYDPLFSPNAIGTLTPLNGGGPEIVVSITSFTERHDAGDDADHLDVLCRRVQFTASAPIAQAAAEAESEEGDL